MGNGSDLVKIRYSLRQLDKIVPQIKMWPEAFALLCIVCERHEITLRFNYNSGWFINPQDAQQKPYLDKGGQGYTVEVGLASFAGDSGEGTVYEKATHAVYDGLRLLKIALQDILADIERGGGEK